VFKVFTAHFPTFWGAETKYLGRRNEEKTAAQKWKILDEIGLFCQNERFFG